MYGGTGASNAGSVSSPHAESAPQAAHAQAPQLHFIEGAAAAASIALSQSQAKKNEAEAEAIVENTRRENAKLQGQVDVLTSLHALQLANAGTSRSNTSLSELSYAFNRQSFDERMQAIALGNKKTIEETNVLRQQFANLGVDYLNKRFQADVMNPLEEKKIQKQISEIGAHITLMDTQAALNRNGINLQNAQIRELLDRATLNWNHAVESSTRNYGLGYQNRINKVRADRAEYLMFLEIEDKMAEIAVKDANSILKLPWSFAGHSGTELKNPYPNRRKYLLKGR
ncbi:MAG: hypothetical protein LBH06_02360 [Rikenellaceae bacterium]|jgi:hypothetical protein|nr:hypothetical protein [Rikenellaceae bacterium]